MPRFSLEKTASAKIDTVYEIFSNFEDYQKLIPQHFPSIRVCSIRGNISVSEEHMNLGNHELLVMAKHVVEKPVLHEIFVIGGNAKGSHIKQQFFDITEGTKIIIDVELKLHGKMRISNIFGKNTLKEDYAKILDDLLHNC